VPSKERPGRDHERRPPVSGERPARRGKERPIAISELRPTHGATEYLQLVAEHRVLELELPDAPALTEECDQANEKEIGERNHGEGMLRAPRSSGESSFGAPHAFKDVGRVELDPQRLDLVPTGHFAA
jgi:hypothetical protein